MKPLLNEGKLHRALYASCMGNMSMAASWLNQAKVFIAQGGSLNDFVAHTHPSNTRKAKAAFVLAQSISTLTTN